MCPSLEDLAYAYTLGLFPMGDEDGEIAWYRSERRALFPMQGIHLSRSLAKTLRRQRHEVRFDTAFEAVMRGCLRPTDNWITEELIESYCAAHEAGWGHSCEVWIGEELVGGVYGLAIGGAFFAESMFHRKTDMSKVALMALVDRCRDLGFTLFDAQVMNPHLGRLGAFEVSHPEYMDLLQAALEGATLWSLPGKLADRS